MSVPTVPTQDTSLSAVPVQPGPQDAPEVLDAWASQIVDQPSTGTGCPANREVGPYVLAGCAPCGDEVEGWAVIGTELSDIDFDHLLISEQVHQDGTLLHRLMSSARHGRTVPVVRIISLVTSIVLFAAVFVGARDGLW